MVSEEVLRRLSSLSEQIGGHLWDSVVENRDQQSGASFIQVGKDGADRQTDLYLSVNREGAEPAMLDLVATLRNAIPLLIEEIGSSKSETGVRNLSNDQLEYLRKLDVEIEPPPWQLVELSRVGAPAPAIDLGPEGVGRRLLTATRDFEQAEPLLLEFLVVARNSLHGLIDTILDLRSP